MSEQIDEIRTETYDLLNVIIGCDTISVFNDKLAHTKAYRQKLKLHSKGLNEEVEKVLNSNLKKMFDIDEEIYQNISFNMSQYVENMSKNIVDMKPTEFLELNQIIKLYTENKEVFQETFEITMRKINEK